MAENHCMYRCMSLSNKLLQYARCSVMPRCACASVDELGVDEPGHNQIGWRLVSSPDHTSLIREKGGLVTFVRFLGLQRSNSYVIRWLTYAYIQGQRPISSAIAVLFSPGCHPRTLVAPSQTRSTCCLAHNCHGGNYRRTASTSQSWTKAFL